MFCGTTWHEDSPLPCRQWMIRRQCIHTGLPGMLTELVILQRQRLFSEWHCRTLHLQPAGKDTDLNDICHEQVEEDGNHLPVAVRHEACE